MGDSGRNEALLVYSLVSSYALNLGVALLAFSYGIILLWEGMLPAPWILSALLVVDFYQRLWIRPVRDARFYDDHFEIHGKNVDINAKYDEISNLTVSRRSFGDWRSATRVSFSVRGFPNTFTLPNRRNRELGLDVPTLILQREPRAGLLEKSND
jgi:hypothetical protein